MLERIRGSTRAHHQYAWFNAIPRLKNITEDLWKEVLAESNVISFPAGTKLIQCGDSATQFVIVLKGVVRVYQAAETGKEICLYRVRSGQVCALTLTKLHTTSNICAQAVAEEDVQILAMPLRYFYRLLSESEDFRNYVMSALADCVGEIMQMVASVSFQRLESRLSCLIWKLSVSESSNKLKFTHQEVANELGTTREVVSRLLKDFENMGCIKLSRGTIEILCEEVLQKISDN